MIRLWHPIRTLPSPGVTLLIRLRDGREIFGIRPRHVTDYEAADLGYRTLDDEYHVIRTDPVDDGADRLPSDAIEWSIA